MKGRSPGDRLSVLQSCREAERHQKQQDRGPSPPNICLLRQSNYSISARLERLIPEINVLVITSVLLFETEREKKNPEPDVCAIRTSSLGGVAVNTH